MGRKAVSWGEILAWWKGDLLLRCAPPVKAPFSLFIAFRYLKPKRTFVSVITALSVLGVTLGITVLIVVISVMTGFDRALQSAILGFAPHITVTNGEIMDNWREVLPKVQKVPGVTGVAPFVQGPVLVQFQGSVHPAEMRGIDPALEENILHLSDHVQDTFGHKIKQVPVNMPSDSIIIGAALAEQLGGVAVGDEITVFAPGNMTGLINEMKRESEDPNAKPKTLKDLQGEFVIPQPLKVTGLFKSGMNSYDANFILVPLSNAQELYGLRDGVHGLSVETGDVRTVDQTKQKIEEALPERKEGDLSIPVAIARTWYQDNQERFDAVHIERNVMFIILMFLIVIAAFGITSTLITVTVQKTREIGIMKAMGATPGQIIWIFLFQGMVVGFFGNITGLIVGLGMIHYRNPFRDFLNYHFHWNLFPPGVYEFDGIPAEVVPKDVAVICACAFVICSVAALIPAFIASRLDPVKALRYE